MTEESTPVMVRMSAKLLKDLDAYRRQEEDLPGRPEAVRRLVEQRLVALTGTAQPTPRKKK